MALQGRLAEGRALLEEAISEHIRTGGVRGLAYRVAWMQGQGLIPNYQSSMSKVYGTELNQRVAAANQASEQVQHAAVVQELQ